MIGTLLVACCLHGGHGAQAPPPDPIQQLEQFEANLQRQPDHPMALYQLGKHLAEAFADPTAIDTLRRALQQGLAGEDAIWARMYVAGLLSEQQRDREAMAEFSALLAQAPAGHWTRDWAVSQRDAIVRRHTALAGVTASETRAKIVIVLAFLSMFGAFWIGRRRAARRAAVAQSS